MLATQTYRSVACKGAYTIEIVVLRSLWRTPSSPVSEREGEGVSERERKRGVREREKEGGEREKEGERKRG
jgi:hypothetical protein